MKQSTKLKPINWSLIYSLIIVSLVIFLFGFVFMKTRMLKHEVDRIFEYFFMIALPIYIFFWFRLKQFIFLPLIIFFALLIMMVFTPPPFKDILVFASLFLSGYNLYVWFISHKHTLHHRKILELAAAPVSDTTDGFTQRPFPVGQITYSKADLYSFGKLLKKLKIAIPLTERDSVILSLPQDWFGRLWHVQGSYHDDTRVVFKFDGTVSAVISEKDYKKYKDQLTFDQLCAAFGNQFVEFLEFFRNGQSTQIVEKLKSDK